MNTTKTGKCSCGVECVFLATVKFPAAMPGMPLREESFCNKGCKMYREAMGRANKAWKVFRAKKEAQKASEEFGRQQAQNRVVLPRAEREARQRNNQLARLATQPKKGLKASTPALGGGNSKKARSKQRKATRLGASI